MTESPTETGMRASDAERHETAEALQRHHADGRLSLAELDDRISAAYAARTREQLTTLLADLPADSAAGPMMDPDPMVGPVDAGLLCAMWWLCPPVGLVYWLRTRRSRRRELTGARR